MNLLPVIRRFERLSGHLAPEAGARLARRLLMRPRRLPPRSWEQAALASAERIHFRFGLSGLRWGTEGPVVLMLHGWEGRASQFAALVPPLLASGRQVIALEAPGHGESPGEESNAILFAYALLEAAAELPPLEAVIGHSMGGGAVAYALSLGLQADRAVLLGAPASLRAVLDRYADWMQLPAPVHQRFLRLVERHTGVDPDLVDVARLGRQLRLPALVVHDRDDTFVPYADGERIAAHWPGAEFLSTEGLGHWNILREAAVVERVVGFITREGLRRAA